jgi:Smr domain-containing protein
MKLKLDLHDIYNRGDDIDRALRAIIDEAVAKKAPVVEIIPGKGSGQLKKRVLRFLEQKEIKALYHRVEKDSRNFGRLFVHFRWLCPLLADLPACSRQHAAGQRRATAAEALTGMTQLAPRPATTLVPAARDRASLAGTRS